MEKKKKTHGRSTRGGENEATEVGSTLVAQRAGGIDEGTHSVGLEGGAHEGGTPGDGGRGGLLGVDEFLLGVGLLGSLVGLAEEGAQDYGSMTW